MQMLCPYSIDTATGNDRGWYGRIAKGQKDASHPARSHLQWDSR